MVAVIRMPSVSTLMEGSGSYSYQGKHYSYHLLIRCVCDAGFSGDGYACQDIDECSDDPSLCPNGACLNYPGNIHH